MVNTITKQTLVDGKRNLVVKTKITGDGSGEESATLLIDMSTYSESPQTLKICRVVSSLVGFSLKLLWDATTDVDALDVLGASDQDYDFRNFGGLVNTKATGFTGDIMFTTTGLGAGDEGTLVLHMVKKYA